MIDREKLLNWLADERSKKKKRLDNYGETKDAHYTLILGQWDAYGILLYAIEQGAFDAEEDAK